MIIRALKDYRDKDTKALYLSGSFREVDESRGAELVSKGFALEYIPFVSQAAEIPDEENVNTEIPKEDAATEPEEVKPSPAPRVRRTTKK